MRKLNYILLAFLLCSFDAIAQLMPIHEMELSASSEKVFLHTTTGIPIFKTSNSYVAIHPETFKKVWEVKRPDAASIAEVTTSESFTDYFELPSSTIAFVGNSFVEVLSGKVLVDGTADEVKRITSLHLFPEKDLMLVKVIAKGVFRLYAFDPIKNTVLWKTDIDELGLNLAGLQDNSPVMGTASGLKPHLSEFGDIIYVHQKNMMLIETKTGKLKWSQPLEPGAILFSKSGKLMAVAERRSGLGEVMGAFSPPKFSKRLVVVDAATGEDAWKKEIKLDGNILFIQPYKDGFIAAHEEGFNIYDFNSTKAEPQWKKDFSAKEISDIVEDGNNIMVYYKDRRILMDPITGDEVWKKPERLAKEVPVFTGGHTERVGDVDITYSGSYLRLNNVKTKHYESFPAHQYAIDEEKNILVASYTPAGTDPMQPGRNMTLYHIDLNTMELVTTEIGLKYNLSHLDIVKDGFFVYGPNSFALARMSDGKLKTVKYEYYPIPGAFGRDLLGLATAAGFVAASGVGTKGQMQAYVVGDEAAMKKYDNRLMASQVGAGAATSLQKRSTLGRIDNEYAFFFSKDDNGNLVLYQILKQDGSETARYKFDDKTPVYEVDYTNGQLYYMNGKTLKIFKLKVS